MHCDVLTAAVVS